MIHGQGKMKFKNDQLARNQLAGPNSFQTIRLSDFQIILGINI